jgi:hypothetical protein
VSGGEWTRLEEHRLYGGVTVEAVSAQFRGEVDQALAAGYLPESLDSSGDDPWHVLNVTYVYDPKRAPRPL